MNCERCGKEAGSSIRYSLNGDEAICEDCYKTEVKRKVADSEENENMMADRWERHYGDEESQSSDFLEVRRLNSEKDSPSPTDDGQTPMASYRGYQIYPRPMQVRDSGRWTTKLKISLDKGYEVAESLFLTANTFETQDKATKACVELGKRIIDGEIKGCSVADL